MAVENGIGYIKVNILNDPPNTKNYIRVKQADDLSIKNYINVKNVGESNTKDYINVLVVDHTNTKDYALVNFVGFNEYTSEFTFEFT